MNINETKSKTSKSKAPASEVSEASDIQHIYADTPVELGIGPFVSRVTFGNQISVGAIVPQFQLIMPSNALLNFAKLIISTFAEEHETGRLQGAHKTFNSQIAGSDKDGKKA